MSKSIKDEIKDAQAILTRLADEFEEGQRASATSIQAQLQMVEQTRNIEMMAMQILYDYNEKESDEIKIYLNQARLLIDSLNEKRWGTYAPANPKAAYEAARSAAAHALAATVLIKAEPDG